MKKYGVNTNIKNVINWVKEIPQTVMSDKLAQRVVEIFKERAKDRIENSGAIQQDVDRFVNAITSKKIRENTYRIYAGLGGDEQLIEDMWYLEFGSGIVGATHKHPKASNISWKYDVNHHGGDGWFFRRKQEFGNQNALIAKNDKEYINDTVRSKGIIAVRYFYDTMQEFDKILSQAMNELGIKL